jgi:hypothetical protein
VRRIAIALSLALATTACGDSASVAEEAPTSSRETPSGRPFAARFVDGTRAAGLHFTHHTGAFGEKRLPETMGAGACLFHSDEDGFLDLFLVDGAPWPDGPDEPEAPSGGCRLFRGRGDGTFEEVTKTAAAGLRPNGMGVIAADHDGGGEVDL